MDIALLISGVLGASSASYVEGADIAKAQMAECAEMRGQLERLDCYDKLARSVGAVRSSQSVSSSSEDGNWRVSISENPIDDSRTVSAMLEAEDGRSRSGDKVLLIARCQSNTTEAYVVWRDYLGNDGDIRNEYKNVLMRIGDAPASTSRWTMSTDSQATFYPKWGGDMLKQLASVDTLVLQTTPYNESPITAVFDVRGISSALQPLAETCGWAFDS